MEVEHLYKSYGDKIIFSDLSLHIEEKSVTLIRGRSGIGKTTLFRLILGLEKPDAGRIEINGKVSALFQEDRLIERLSVMNNLLLVTDDRKRASYLLAEASLDGEEKSRVSTLSGGMKRRVALVRALLTDYDILLLDEPFTGLDEGAKRNMASLLKKEVGDRTLIVISHDDEDCELLGSSNEIELRSPVLS